MVETLLSSHSVTMAKDNSGLSEDVMARDRQVRFHRRVATMNSKKARCKPSGVSPTLVALRTEPQAARESHERSDGQWLVTFFAFGGVNSPSALPWSTWTIGTSRFE